MRDSVVSFVRCMACFSALLLILVGCAGGPRTSVLVRDASEQQQDFVSRLEPGRVGFVVSDKGTYNKQQLYYFERGEKALKSGVYDTAVNSFKTVTKSAPEQSSPWVNLAIAYARSGRDDQAEEPLKKALDLVTGHPLASHEYGLLLRRAGRFAEAKTVYETALQYFPEYYPLYRNFGVLCDIYLNDPECAARQYALFLEAQPEDEQVKLWLSEVQGRLGQ